MTTAKALMEFYCKRSLSLRALERLCYARNPEQTIKVVGVWLFVLLNGNKTLQKNWSPSFSFFLWKRRRGEENLHTKHNRAGLLCISFVSRHSFEIRHAQSTVPCWSSLTCLSTPEGFLVIKADISDRVQAPDKKRALKWNSLEGRGGRNVRNR